MNNLEKLLQDTVDMSYDGLLDNASEAAELLYRELEEIADDEDDITTFFLGIVTACVGTDGTLSELEYEFFRDVFELDVDYDELLEAVNEWGYNDAVDFIFDLVDDLSYDGNTALGKLCLAFMAVDEKISTKETDFLDRLIRKICFPR